MTGRIRRTIWGTLIWALVAANLVLGFGPQRAETSVRLDAEVATVIDGVVVAAP
ncbi:MAG: hypothetical protein ACXWXQ_02645 [Actinomycetota bacterium]|jgi:hypothetical protein